jgi:TolA-binding protein
LLDEIVQRFPNDPRSSTALFTMGNVERARGNHARAARAFRRCWRLYPSGPLAEDARAEAAASWASAGRRDWAAEAARRYLAIYPEGTHAKRMERLAE